jgi:uncharacterized protein (TIGR04552 family)
MTRHSAVKPPGSHAPKPPVPPRSVREMGLKDLERLRLLLRGGSVIEWRRMHFESREEVDQFLRLCQMNPDDPIDEDWCRTVLRDAVDYLRGTFNYRVADAVAHPSEIHDIFLYASGLKEPKRYQKIACIVLKVMHVIQHIEGRDLLFRTQVSEADLARLVTDRVAAVVAHMRAQKLPVVEFSDSIKSRESLITKLLAKKETIAAQIYDKTRFRIVTESRDEILPVLAFLTSRLFPFNFVVPGQTENTLIPFREVVEKNPHLAKLVDQLHLDFDYEERLRKRKGNRFSGESYRMLNFVADIPIRLDDFLPPVGKDFRERKCRMTFALVEFQLVDRQTAIENEHGDNAHELYKTRQRIRVLRRLSRGLIVPKRKKKTGGSKKNA